MPKLKIFSYTFQFVRILSILFGLSAFMVSNAPNLVGNRTNYGYSDDITGLREARRGVKVFTSVPEDATNFQNIETRRCHQNFTEDASTEETLKDDLIVAAYAAGADGITNITHKKESGLMKNCWHIPSAQGTIFRLS